MSDPVTPAKEAQIRNNERHRIAHLLENEGDAIVKYLSDPRDAVKLIAYLLRLEADREASGE
ncbi:hypothetical protein KHO61_gp008 [Mycobacterium phage Mangeria]|uniref:Uncharacterized protein n=1 Tax=Mycobacterium phage Mangeria TaxID=2686471 RepID=A0A6B9LUQ0_9CAUD|nr:hypothetical protein KHO61_gp008 [Mycobacterium phage Mangeria]QHB47578.1 hypothetical protein SEA_MANGERIA_8 [Mycobacterium phage Mangeria]